MYVGYCNNKKLNKKSVSEFEMFCCHITTGTTTVLLKKSTQESFKVSKSTTVYNQYLL